MAPIRVAAIAFDWYPFDVRVRRMAEAAMGAGYDMDVICLRREGEKAFEVCNGVRVYRVPLDRGFGRPLSATVLEWLHFMAHAAARVTWLHLRRHYDVIVVHNMPDFLIFAATLPKLLGAKLVLDVEDPSPELMASKSSGRRRAILTTFAAWQEHVSAAFADHVVTVGWTFEELLLRRGVPKHKVTLILNSADPNVFPPERRAPAVVDSGGGKRPFVVIYYGTLAERNGVATAIRAVKLALPNTPNLRLDIMGRGEELPALRALTQELDITDHVVFIESRPPERVADFVLNGDVGIIPYHADVYGDLVLPTKAYEMAWMGRPIIASNTRALRSMFRPQSVRLCDVPSPECFAEAILELYADPQKRAHMIVSASEDYEALRWEPICKRYQELLASLSGKARQPVGAKGSSVREASHGHADVDVHELVR
jgi:glycosyltransferase involved in cell wall biosynthesis